MIHTIHTCTLRRFSEVEATGNVSLLRRGFNPLPAVMFPKRIEKLFKEYRKIVNVDSGNVHLQREKSRMISINKINQLDKYYQGLFMSFQEKAVKIALSILSNRDIPNRMSFEYYADEVEKKTGIKIKEPKDLRDLISEIKRREDKHRQIFAENKRQESDAISLCQYAIGIFSFLDMPYNEGLTLYEFGELKKLYDERVKRMETEKVKHG